MYFFLFHGDSRVEHPSPSFFVNVVLSYRPACSEFLCCNLSQACDPEAQWAAVWSAHRVCMSVDERWWQGQPELDVTVSGTEICRVPWVSGACRTEHPGERTGKADKSAQ